MKINGIEYQFNIDTSFGGDILFSKKKPDKNIETFPTQSILYGKVFQVAGGSVISDTVKIKKLTTCFFLIQDLLRIVS